MLQRYTSLSKEGELKQIGNPRILYAVMLKMRLILFDEVYFFLSVGATIGTRYAMVRSQFKDKSTGEEKIERPLIDYQTHQHRIFPKISQCFVFNFTAQEIYKKNDKVLR